MLSPSFNVPETLAHLSSSALPTLTYWNKPITSGCVGNAHEIQYAVTNLILKSKSEMQKLVIGDPYQAQQLSTTTHTIANFVCDIFKLTSVRRSPIKSEET